MENLLKNKTVVIIGGAGLLGRNFVKSAVSAGAEVVIADVDKQKAVEVKREIGGDLSQIEACEVDITSEESLENLISVAYGKFGKIDAIVNASYPRTKNFGADFLSTTYNDFCENVNLHLGGYVLASQRFCIYFKKQGHGNIINVSSIYGVVPPKFDLYKDTTMTITVEYSTVKAAIIRLTEYIANYFADSNIRINTISPGGILDKQPQVFLKRYRAQCLNKGMLGAKDLDGTLLFLLSDMSEYINGQNIIVDDGFTL